MTQTNLVNRYLSIDKCVRDAGGSRFRGNDRVWLGTGDSSLPGIEMQNRTIENVILTIFIAQRSNTLLY